MIGPGSTLEKYEILDKVGEGGMATVFRGRHRTLQREVAIKVLHRHLASSEKNRVRFEREARAIEGLSHPHILRIFDYSGATGEDCYIVTEFIQGPTLRTLLDDVGLMMSEPVALVGRALCLALEAAHARGIVHRDIKPENVMIDRSGAVKLMDFGIARVMDESHVTVTGALVGSPAYMSPEQATDGKVDARSDLFSLGTMMYRMATGAQPFRGGNPSIVLKAIIDGVYDDPMERVPSMSPALAALIRQCLARDRADRPANASELRIALDHCLRDVGIDPEAPGEWNLDRYVAAPEPYEDRLRALLVPTLLTLGRGQAREGATARAIRTLQRVLAIDEDNREVHTILEGLRAEVEREEAARRARARRPILLRNAALFTVGLGCVGAVFAALRGGTSAPAETTQAELPRVAPDPTPSPLVEPRRNEHSTPALPAGGEATPAAARPRPRPERPGGQPGPRRIPVEPARLRPDPTPALVAAINPAVHEPACTGEGRLRVTVDKSEGYARITVRDASGVSQVKDRYAPVDLRLPAGSYDVLATSDYFQAHTVRGVRVCSEQADRVVNIAGRTYLPSWVTLTGCPPEARIAVSGTVVGTVATTGGRVAIDRMGALEVEVTLDQQEIGRRVVTRGIDARGNLLPGQGTTLTCETP